jgi:hypothetical protein
MTRAVFDFVFGASGGAGTASRIPSPEDPAAGITGSRPSGFDPIAQDEQKVGRDAAQS